jgi:hypothetical protein
VQEVGQPALLVTTAGAPDGGRVTPHAGGDGGDGLPRGDGQDDAGALDLEPGPAPAPSHCLEDREVSGAEGQGVRFSATHGTTSDAEDRFPLQHTAPAEFLA